MIHEAYMPVYIGSRFSLRTYGCTGPPEVVQEALVDLKNLGRATRISSHFDHHHIIITKGNHNHHDHFTTAGPICSTSEFSRWIPFPLLARI